MNNKGIPDVISVPRMVYLYRRKMNPPLPHKENLMKTFRVVICDDNPVFIKSLETMLRSIPHVIVVGIARNGVEALGETRRTQPDVLLMDIMMPEMDGINATKYIKRFPHPPRIILISAHDRLDFHLAAKASGADSVLWKPVFGRKRLREVIYQNDATNGDSTGAAVSA